jgi:hypothetical protein
VRLYPLKFVLLANRVPARKNLPLRAYVKFQSS